MHITTNGTAKIRDRKSGQIYEIEADELSWDTVRGEERGMGLEITWQADISHPALGDLVWKLWEYPAGIENYQDQELNGHELVENFDISLRHDADEPDEFDDPFDVASRALAAGQEPIFGSVQEQLERQEVLDALTQIDIGSTATIAEHGGVGHNNPPSGECFTHDELCEMRELVGAIRAELHKPQPDALKVIEAASKMRRIGQWVLARVTKGADAFADTVGKAGGAAFVASVVLPDPTILWTQILQTVTKIGAWLLTVL
jgi:hypothetical protein